jgi:hypothetical protein
MYKYLSDFESYYRKIIDMGVFNVHYVSYISDDFLTNTKPREVDHCLSSGRYCALPRFDLGIMDGRTIIQENIRQQCIFHLSYVNASDSLRKDYFNYIRGFFNKCLSLESKVFSEACSIKVISEDLDKVTVQDVNRCVYDSYESPLNQSNAFTVNNKLLDQHYSVEKNLNVQVLPGIVVNGREIYGGIKAYNLFEAICGAFLTTPPVCSEKEILSKNTSEKEENDLSTGVIILIIFIVILVNIIVVYICKKYIVKKMHEKIESSEMNGKINNVVTAYLQLRDK